MLMGNAIPSIFPNAPFTLCVFSHLSWTVILMQVALVNECNLGGCRVFVLLFATKHDTHKMHTLSHDNSQLWGMSGKVFWWQWSELTESWPQLRFVLCEFQTFHCHQSPTWMAITSLPLTQTVITALPFTLWLFCVWENALRLANVERKMLFFLSYKFPMLKQKTTSFTICHFKSVCLVLVKSQSQNLPNLL